METHISHKSQTLNYTPVEVKPRRMAFAFDQVAKRYFFDDNALKSADIAALSATFPAGEGEFISSVRMFKDKIDDPVLQEQIKGFIGQEGQHSQQNRQFNVAIKNLGVDEVRLEKVFEKDMKRSLKARTKETRLAFTVCFEHQTAILANEFFTNPKVLEGRDEHFAELMRWQSIEEIEHKGGAFELYKRTMGDRKLLNKAQRIATVLVSARVREIHDITFVVVSNHAKLERY